jgi:hypothetical protein
LEEWLPGWARTGEVSPRARERKPGRCIVMVDLGLRLEADVRHGGWVFVIEL